MKALAINSEWEVVGTNWRFTIDNLWFNGTGHKCRVTGYQLRYPGRASTQYKTAAQLQQLIDNNTIKQL